MGLNSSGRLTECRFDYFCETTTDGFICFISRPFTTHVNCVIIVVIPASHDAVCVRMIHNEEAMDF